MIYSLSGKLTAKKQNFVVVEANGIGFKVFVCLRTLRQLPKINGKVSFFCYTSVKQDGIELYGFLTEKELEVFELLNSVSGIGPKSALEITGVSNIEKFLAAVSGARIDILEKSWGISRKKAERIVLELKDKLGKFKFLMPKASLRDLDYDKDLKSVLKNLGYKQKEIEEAVKNLPENLAGLEKRLRAVLKNIK